MFSRCVQQDDAEKALKANHMNIESAIGKFGNSWSSVQ